MSVFAITAIVYATFTKQLSINGNTEHPDAIKVCQNLTAYYKYHYNDDYGSFCGPIEETGDADVWDFIAEYTQSSDTTGSELPSVPVDVTFPSHTFTYVQG